MNKIKDEEFEVPASNDAKVPRWLILTYIVLPIWGIYVWGVYWNGSVGWLDRGYWQQLQEAANTTTFWFDEPKNMANLKNEKDSK